MPASPVRWTSPPSGEESDDKRAALVKLLVAQAETAARIRCLYASLKQHPDTRYFTYSLLLQNSKVYVGNSDNIYQRLADHLGMTSQSSQWVREHGPVVRVAEIIRDSAPDVELYKTLEWCDMVGYENVRGASFCRVALPGPPAALATFVRDPHKAFNFLTRKEIDDVVDVARRIAGVAHPTT